MSLAEAQNYFMAAREANLRNQAGSLLYVCQKHRVSPRDVLDMYEDFPPSDLLYALVNELWSRYQDELRFNLSGNA